MDTKGPIKWKISFKLDGRTYVTDRAILLDQRFAFVDPLPPDGTEKNNEQIRAKNYERFHKFWTLPARKIFGFSDLSIMEGGNYAGPDKLILNQKYISFLLRRIPQDLLRFGMTGGSDSVVRLYRGEEHIGLLMPFRVFPDFGPELMAQAESGDAESQAYLGWLYQMGAHGAPEDLQQAVFWYAKAALQNHPRAFHFLGTAFCYGIGVEQDFEKGLLFFEKAIELGNKEAIQWRALAIERMPPEKYRGIAARIACQMEKKDALSTEAGG